MGRKSKQAATPPPPAADAQGYESLLTDASMIYAEPTLDQERLLLSCNTPRPDDSQLSFACALIVGKLRKSCGNVFTGISVSSAGLPLETILSGSFDSRIVGDTALWAIRSLIERKQAALLLVINGVAPVVASDDPESVLIHASAAAPLPRLDPASRAREPRTHPPGGV